MWFRLAQPDEPCTGAHWPGLGCLDVAGQVPVVGRPQVGRNQRLDWMTSQFVLQVAEHFLPPPVGQHEHAVAVGQHHPVLQGINQFPHHGGCDRGSMPIR